jgi:uncharacterized protein (UPF0261 family)
LIIATLDTKPEEARFLRARLEEQGLAALIADGGSLGSPPFVGDITRREVAAAAGWELEALVATGDKGKIQAAQGQGLAAIAGRLAAEGRIQGVIAVGGGQGTALGTGAMQGLPLGFPKVMVSTLASGNLRPFLGTSDIAVFPSVADMLGMNSVLERTLGNAAAALAGMMRQEASAGGGAPPRSVGVSAFGVVTPGLMKMKPLLERAGLQPVFFHANGVGGQAMEDLARAGHFQALVDWTTHEILDLVAGGIFVPPASRLDILAERPLPCLVGLGAMDYIVKGPAAELDEAWRSRNIIVHNRNITLVRATGEEMARAARTLSAKLNRALGPVAVMVPLRGFSEPNARGKQFYDPEADQVFLSALRAGLDSGVKVVERDEHINDSGFVAAAVEQLQALCARAQAEAGPATRKEEG